MKYIEFYPEKQGRPATVPARDMETSELATPATPSGHSARHENGGVDEISLTGLEGEEIRFTPTASSSGAKGTIFYKSSDDSFYAIFED